VKVLGGLLGPRDAAGVAFAKAGRPPAGTPWREAGWCALDLELTGLDPRRDDIIAVGAVPIEQGRVLLGKSVYTLVRTSKRSEVAAVLVHKLRLADLADAPPLDHAIELVLGAFAGRVPVFHTAAVERAFLRRPFARQRVRLPAAADTELLGRAWLRERDGVTPAGISLARLATVLGLPAEPPHHALGDALTTAKAFIALASHLDSVEPQTVGTLLQATTQWDAVRRFGPG
jgi:DNA polymerase III subunit epsilon